jgi:hypothetical protein
MFIRQNATPQMVEETSRLGGGMANMQSNTKLSSANPVQGAAAALDLNYTSDLKLKDLRSLDESYHDHDEPSLIIRRHVILLSLNPYRVVITSTHFILVGWGGIDVEVLYFTISNSAKTNKTIKITFLKNKRLLLSRACWTKLPLKNKILKSRRRQTRLTWLSR